MQKEILLVLLEQSRQDCSAIVKKITAENAGYRLMDKTASAGFIYRHLGEATNLLGQFYGHKSDTEASTMGQADTGKQYDLNTSSTLLEQGYATLEKVINTTPEDKWLEEIDTTWFGKVSRMKLLSITLLHLAHHGGQIASAVAKGKV